MPRCPDAKRPTEHLLVGGIRHESGLVVSEVFLTFAATAEHLTQLFTLVDRRQIPEA
jgi:hypothetical protein